ncbi:Hydroxyproline-rich glycoprotein family protein [Euphorbia peplus]|nr:Hydroxyproline-rich glycoprotein family protein [Euphorbia peplus]
MSSSPFCGLNFFHRKTSTFEMDNNPKKELTKQRSRRGTNNGNFILMMDLRKKIFTFRDIIDLPLCDGTESINELLSKTIKDLHKLQPEIVSRSQISELKEASIDKVLLYFCEALRNIGDRWTNTRDWRDKVPVDMFDNREKLNAEKIVEMALVTLDCIITLAEEKFDMMDGEDENTESLEGNPFGAILMGSYSESESLSSSCCVSPITPNSVLPQFDSSPSSDDFANTYCSSPVLRSLRVQAVEKLNPLALKHFSFHMLSNMGASEPSNVNLKNNVDDETMTEIEAENRILNQSRVHEESIAAQPVASGTVSAVVLPVLPPESLTSRTVSATLPPSTLTPETATSGFKPLPLPPGMRLKAVKIPEPPTPPSTPLTQQTITAAPPSPPPPPVISAAAKGARMPPSPVTSGSVASSSPLLLKKPSAIATPPHTPMTWTTKTMALLSPTPLSPLILPAVKRAPSPPPLAPPPPPPPTTSGTTAVPPPPPAPIMSSKGSMQLPPPPPMPLANGTAPPPPPPSCATRSLRPKKAATKLRRSTQIGNLYRVLKGKVEGGNECNRSTNGRKGSPKCSNNGQQGMADALAEITKRSSYFQQIEEDVEKYASSIIELKKEITTFKNNDMTGLIKFQKHVESILEHLTDESQVLARFEGFPQKKLEALRSAAALCSKLNGILSELQNWKIETPLGKLLDKAECYFDKIKKEIDAMDRTKDEDSKKFQSQNINVDFHILVQIKESMVDVSSNCMELVLKESRGAKTEDTKKANCKMLWRAFQFAFRVYSFAGGHDDRADKLTKELAHEIQTDDPQH